MRGIVITPHPFPEVVELTEQENSFQTWGIRPIYFYLQYLNMYTLDTQESMHLSKRRGSASVKIYSYSSHLQHLNVYFPTDSNKAENIFSNMEQHTSMQHIISDNNLKHMFPQDI